MSKDHPGCSENGHFSEMLFSLRYIRLEYEMTFDRWSFLAGWSLLVGLLLIYFTVHLNADMLMATTDIQ